MNTLTVTRAEAGQKLLNFLQRRFEAAPAELHRWIRTGQVRLNGGRVKAFDRVTEGDAVRVPPFARPKHAAEKPDAPTRAAESDPRQTARGSAPSPAWPAIDIVWENGDILVLNKPAGLPSQGGTGHTDSVAARLAARYAGTDFTPAPVHRLDRDTSGLLVVGKSYAALRSLTDALAGRAGEAPRKEYLAWVRGAWPEQAETELRDRLCKERGERRMRVLPAAFQESPAPDQGCDERIPLSDRNARDRAACAGQEARCLVRPLEARRLYGMDATLLLVRLLTGRTHQIRIQLASRGFPVLGDTRYGARPHGEEAEASRRASLAGEGGEPVPRPGGGHDRGELAIGLKLHAWRLTLPACAVLPEPVLLTCPPPWTPPFDVRSCPGSEIS